MSTYALKLTQTGNTSTFVNLLTNSDADTLIDGLKKNDNSTRHLKKIKVTCPGKNVEGYIVTTSDSNLKNGNDNVHFNNNYKAMWWYPSSCELKIASTETIIGHTGNSYGNGCVNKFRLLIYGGLKLTPPSDYSAKQEFYDDLTGVVKSCSLKLKDCDVRIAGEEIPKAWIDIKDNIEGQYNNIDIKNDYLYEKTNMKYTSYIQPTTKTVSALSSTATSGRDTGYNHIAVIGGISYNVTWNDKTYVIESKTITWGKTAEG